MFEYFLFTQKKYGAFLVATIFMAGVFINFFAHQFIGGLFVAGVLVGITMFIMMEGVTPLVPEEKVSPWVRGLLLWLILLMP